MIDFKALALLYFETFSRKDLDGLARLFTANPTLRDWTGSSEGLDNVLAANKSIFDAVETIVVAPLAVYQDGSTVVAEIEVLINSSETLLVVDVITFEDDKISSVRAYKG